MEALSLAALVTMFLVVGKSWPELPGRIPVHFGFLGQPNSWGGKDSIWLLPGLGVLVYGFLSFARGRPYLMNVPFEIDKSNPKVLALLHDYLAVSKASVMLVLAILCWRSVEVAAGRAAGLGTVFLPLTMALIFVPIITYFVKLSKVSLD